MQSRQIELLTILAEGCKKHPAYRARRRPSVECVPCAEMWETRAALKEIEQTETSVPAALDKIMQQMEEDRAKFSDEMKKQRQWFLKKEKEIFINLGQVMSSVSKEQKLLLRDYEERAGTLYLHKKNVVNIAGWLKKSKKQKKEIVIQNILICQMIGGVILIKLHLIILNLGLQVVNLLCHQPLTRL